MGRRPWDLLKKFSVVAAVGTTTAITLDPTHTLRMMAYTFSTLGTLNLPPLLDLDCSEKIFRMDSSMKIMLKHSKPMHENCNLYPMLKNLVSHTTKYQLFYPPKSYTIDRNLYHLAGSETTHSCLRSSCFSSCHKLNPQNPDFFSFWTMTHKSISGSKHQCQCHRWKHLYPPSQPWARRNTLSYLRVYSLYSFNLGSFNSLPSLKPGLLGSMFSSLFSASGLKFSSPTSPYATESKSFHVWHYPGGDGEEKEILSEEKPVMAVVLLGWLGAQQKHLKKYADWYNSRGIHAVTFVVPMKDLLGFKPGEKVEQYIEILTKELACWISEKEKDGRDRWLMFHTFSNTGWLSYGVILEKLPRTGDFYEKIKGCVVDSAPEPEPNPQVWALGFLAALLKKRSRLLFEPDVKNSQKKDSDIIEPTEEKDPTLSEVALLTILEKFFSVMLKHPYVHKRLSELTSILYQHQPPCPQLYIYSTADRVIPAESVLSFIEEQKKAGKKVTACNMQSSPHVDHFRSFPHIYTKQLHHFLEECTQIVSQ